MVDIGGALNRLGRIGGGFIDVVEAPIQLTMDLLLAPVREDEYDGIFNRLGCISDHCSSKRSDRKWCCHLRVIR